ncbi:hypothetical protein [Vibrio quintilis]|uniref:Uncharacterized protein n=1 Tax=Vibrio quintilis TaxID=1117707 RepID=A0A1M7Z215_9VIBR|nr:hypothetical protein [Vibrio quintilis]SHO58933.1 hypothetical protein VQ7734_04708 [Vibrio quintilis]
MKASRLVQLLHSLTGDPEVVTGEEWLPERLVHAKQLDNYLFLEFDNVPEDNQGEEEGRGFVEHEINLIREQIMQIFQEEASLNSKQEAILALILYAHERTSSEVVEMLGHFGEESPTNDE